MANEIDASPEMQLGIAQNEDAARLLGRLRTAAKHRKRIAGWMSPLVFAGMVLTIGLGIYVDIRLSVAIFCTMAVAILGAFLSGYYQLNRLALRAGELCDIRAIGP